MKNKIKLSVLLCTYNDEKYIKLAINSVLCQTYDNFEFIIVNDGSTDDTQKIIESFKDSRIKLFNKENTGLIDSLNFGISKTQGEYIARMDGDDICLKDRFQIQLDYMESHPSVDICGSNAIVIDSNNQKCGKIQMPLNDEEIKMRLMFSSAFIHPTVFIKRSVFINNKYSSNYPVAEDYELWARLSKSCIFANLRDKLIFYRVHSNNVSMQKKEIGDKSVRQIIKTYYSSFLEDNNIYSDFILSVTDIDSKEYLLWLKHFIKDPAFSNKIFRRFFIRRWLRLCYKKKSFNLFVNNKLICKYLFDYIFSVIKVLQYKKLR